MAAPVVSCSNCGKKYRIRDKTIRSFRCARCEKPVFVLQPPTAGLKTERALDSAMAAEDVWQELKQLRAVAILGVPFAGLLFLILSASRLYGLPAAFFAIAALACTLIAIFMEKHPRCSVLALAWLASVAPAAFLLFVVAIPTSVTGLRGSGKPIGMLLLFGGIGTVWVAVKTWGLLPRARQLEVLREHESR
jgi:DNA-directed RNA polymerase subunit RPC12/RpoP